MSRIEARNVKMLGCVVAAFDHSVILEVRNLTVYPVILLMNGDSGGPFLAEVPHPASAGSPHWPSDLL